MSSTTPPKTGIDAPHTPLRPPAAVTGTPASWQSAAMPATSDAEAGRATAAARAGTWPAVAQIMARGHQSRLASAVSPGSTLTTAHTSERRSRKAPSSATGSAGSRDEAPEA